MIVVKDSSPHLHLVYANCNRCHEDAFLSGGQSGFPVAPAMLAVVIWPLP